MVLMRRGEEEVSCWRCVVLGSSGVDVDVAWGWCGMWCGGKLKGCDVGYGVGDQYG